MVIDMSIKEKVLNIASNLIGTAWRAGQSCQCANFVRYVFTEAGAPLPAESKPIDMNLLPKDAPQGASFANSFAGDSVGKKINIANLQAGDIVMFCNTYGDYTPGVITHVGIAIDSDSFIHRPTADRPVEKTALSSWWIDHIADIRRPHIYELKSKVKFFIHDGKGSAFINDIPGNSVIKIYGHDNKATVFARSITGVLMEYKKADLSISDDAGKWIKINVYNNKYTIQTSEGYSSDSDPIAIIFDVIEGKPHIFRTLGIESYLSDGFTLQALLET